jgi:hypothetical protein
MTADVVVKPVGVATRVEVHVAGGWGWGAAVERRWWWMLVLVMGDLACAGSCKYYCWAA